MFNVHLYFYSLLAIMFKKIRIYKITAVISLISLFYNEINALSIPENQNTALQALDNKSSLESQKSSAVDMSRKDSNIETNKLSDTNGVPSSIINDNIVKNDSAVQSEDKAEVSQQNNKENGQVETTLLVGNG